MADLQFIEAEAAAVAAIGEPSFPERLLDLLRGLLRADLCSAFEASDDGNLTFLFAAGEHPHIRGFAEAASLAYARSFWQRDRTTRQALSSPPGSIQMVRQAWNGIIDPDYRRICYERGGIVERLTLYAPGKPTVFASAYRMKENGHSTAAELEELERASALIMALVCKHAAMLRRQALHQAPSLRDLSRLIMNREHALSAREADVVASLLLGKSQTEIAEEAGVALSSVVTYRRRAYRKLGVSTRRDLQKFLSVPGSFKL